MKVVCLKTCNMYKGGFIMGQLAKPGIPYYTAAGVIINKCTVCKTHGFLTYLLQGIMTHQPPNNFYPDGNGNVSLAYATRTGALFSRNENGHLW